MGLVTRLQTLTGIPNVSTGPYPKDHYHSFLMSENTDPTYLIIGDIQNGWTPVYHNSFKLLNNWLATISKEFNTTALQIIWQTTSDVYHFLVYEKGIKRREIYFYSGDIESAIDFGQKFKFEKSQVVPTINQFDEVAFDRDTIERYCKELGFDLFRESEPEYYYILKKKQIGKTITQYAKDNKTNKAWWKFW